MKTLQNNFTTPEQSKRLLELGVPAWTADIMFDKNRRKYELIETDDESLAETQRTMFYNGGATPHWSVGRLREIFYICSSVNGTRKYPFYNDQVIWWITEFEFNKEFIDFSKLED